MPSKYLPVCVYDLFIHRDFSHGMNFFKGVYCVVSLFIKKNKIFLKFDSYPLKSLKVNGCNRKETRPRQPRIQFDWLYINVVPCKMSLCYCTRTYCIHYYFIMHSNNVIPKKVKHKLILDFSHMNFTKVHVPEYPTPYPVSLG